MGTIDAIDIDRDAIPAKRRVTPMSLRVVIALILEGIVDRTAKRRSRAALADLTDDQLRDVGLTRSDVRRELANSSFWR